MAFKRVVETALTPTAEQLSVRMVGIGMNFAAKADDTADIERTLLHASILGMEQGDLRVLAVLTNWFGVHHAHVNADRLVRMVAAQPAQAAEPLARVRGFWAAMAMWQQHDRRFARLAAAHDGVPLDLLPAGTAFQISRRGEDARFVGSPLQVPAGVLRDRPQDVLAPEVLLKRHAGYRNRVLMGPSFRADVWTALDHDPDRPVADIARAAACSFATAWQVAQAHRLLRGKTAS